MMSWASSCAHALAARRNGSRGAGSRSEGYGVWLRPSSLIPWGWCLLMVYRWVSPKESPPLGGAVLSKGTPSTGGSLHSMADWYRDTKAGPCASSWNISEGLPRLITPVVLAGISNVNYITVQCHLLPSSTFLTLLQILFLKYFPVNHLQANVYLNICLQTMTAPSDSPKELSW